MGLNRRIQHYRRYRQIGETLIRHGFGYLIEQLDLRHVIPARLRWFRRDESVTSMSLGERVRHVLEELGPTFVKLGQTLAERTDMLPPSITEELSLLQDKVPPFAADAAREIVEQETGRRVDDLFLEFEEEPLAAASMAQVHRATLRSGEQVVVKLRRPGIESSIETDVDILLGLARLAKERLDPDLIDPVQVVREFARVVRRELDFRIEGRHLQRFRDNFDGEEGIQIPEVYWLYSTARCLVIEYVQGVKITDIKRLEAWGIDKRLVARRSAEAFLKQVMLDGYFHGDPHPGNLLVKEDGALAFIDFGVVGRLSQDEKEALADMFLGVVRLDVEPILRGLRRLGAIGSEVNLTDLRTDLTDLIDRHYGKSLREIEIGAVLSDLLEVVYRHRVRLPPDFLLLGKAFVTMEGIGGTLDPHFNVVEIAEPFARRLMSERFAPERLLEKSRDSLRHYVDIMARIPPAIDQTVTKLNSGELEIPIQHRGLDRLINRLDIVSNRISFSLIIGALIVGSSIVTQAQVGPAFHGMPLLGVLGYLIAGIFGMGLVLSILRSGRL